MTIHPIAKALAWWLFWHPMAAPDDDARPIRLVDKPCLHVGVRPHGDPGEAAITVQVTACTPF